MQYISEDNFLLFAKNAYNVPHFIEYEFYSDIKRIKYIKRILEKYEKTGIIKERLFLNHIILFYNVFDTESATKILFFKIKEKHYAILKTFLLYLNYMPKQVIFNNKILKSCDIKIDEKLQQKLFDL